MSNLKTNIASQIPSNLMFRYRLPCRKTAKSWSKDIKLGAEHKLELFGQFEAQNQYADIRSAWNADGLIFTVEVKSKKQSLWCRQNQILDSDGAQFWIDTRCTQNVHRATRFCHWFAALPAGGGPRHDKPVVSMIKINRAKEDSPTLNRGKLEVFAKTTKSGYMLRLFIQATALNGWNPEDHRQIGFSCNVFDREFGWQTLGVGPEFPIAEDPSLWHVLQLTE